MNTTFKIFCDGWKDEGINIDRDAPITEAEYTLSYEVRSFEFSYLIILCESEKLPTACICSKNAAAYLLMQISL